MAGKDRDTGWYTAPVDEVAAQLRMRLLEALQPGRSPKEAAFWGDVLADHVRNRHRKARGLDPIVARWDRGAPERRVVVVMETQEQVV